MDACKGKVLCSLEKLCKLHCKVECLCTQVFAQPIFETAEQWIQNRRYILAQRPVLMRVVVRCSYVALTCFVAILIPFFGDLMG